MGSFFGFLISLAIGGSILANSIKIVKQGNQALVETFGKYNGKTLEPGLNILIPIAERVAIQASLRERVLDIPPQNCVTKDNLSITADAVVHWRIVNLAKAYYQVEDLRHSMAQIVMSQIREQMAKFDRRESFTARTVINEVLQRELATAAEPWGVKVFRVELRDILNSKK